MCQLCKIIDQERTIKETKHSFSVVCKRPLKKGHVMVLPKRHVTHINDLNPQEAYDFLQLVGDTVEQIKKTYDDDPIIFQNYRVHSSEPHIHFHVLPSKANLRKMMSKYEGVPEAEDKPDEFSLEIREEILNANN